MAVTLTEILGTDSISGSRIVINDNFSILRDEINAIEVYLDPDAGTLDGLNSIQSLELKVGPVGTYLLDITSTAFNVNTSVNFTQALSLININGLIAQNSFTLLNEASYPGSTIIDPLVGYGTYSIKHASTSDFTIEVKEANPGQEITFSVEQKGGGNIIIKAAVDALFVIDSTNNKISLNDVGSTVTLRFIIDSSNNGAFYIVSGHNYIPTI
jgi:hypothetical protein